MTTASRILAIDCATVTGWAYGPAGTPPRSGYVRFGKDSSSTITARYLHCLQWVTEFHTHNPFDEVVIEAPLPASQMIGKSTADTQRVLNGLPAIIHAMAAALGCYKISYVNMSSVRSHFLGKGHGRTKGDEAKHLVRDKCLRLRWIGIEDSDPGYNRTDAMAIWSYAEWQLHPKLALPVEDVLIGRSFA